MFATDQQSAPAGHVYFLVMDEPHESDARVAFVKIGITREDVPKRVATLQTGNPYRLTYFDFLTTRWPAEVEHFMHRIHAEDMHRDEWMRCSRDCLPNLVAEAKEAARRIEDRKATEEQYRTHTSDGIVRDATCEEKELRAEAQGLLNKLVLAQLHLKIAENRIKAATGATCGIPAIVRVNRIPEGKRFSEEIASSRFPARYRQFNVETMCGNFQWHDRPKPGSFQTEHKLRLAAEKAAKASVREFLLGSAGLDGLTGRTPEIEGWHDDFLKALSAIHRLRGDLADLQTAATILLGESEGIDQVCSFRRHLDLKFNSSEFRENFAESEQCVAPVASYLKKHVYRSRSYL